MDFVDVYTEHYHAGQVFAKEISKERAGVRENALTRTIKLQRWFRCTNYFAYLMRLKLARVRHKRDWRKTSLNYRIHRLREEFLEAMVAHERYRDYTINPSHNDYVALRLQNDLVEELTDIGITAMMAADYFRSAR